MKSPNVCRACQREQRTGEMVPRHDLPSSTMQVVLHPPEPQIRIVSVPMIGVPA